MGLKQNKLRLENEIATLTNIVNSKLAKSEQKQKKIEDCKTFIETQSDQQEQKIINLGKKIEDQQEYILGLKRQIVLLEYKNHSQMSTMIDMKIQIEDKMFDKILGNEQLQNFKHQKATIIRKQIEGEVDHNKKSEEKKVNKENSNDDNIPNPENSAKLPVPELKPAKSSSKSPEGSVNSKKQDPKKEVRKRERVKKKDK